MKKEVREMGPAIEYWIEGRYRGFMRAYLLTYPLLLVLGSLFAVRERNAFLFLILGAVPASIIWTLRLRHDPGGEIETLVIEQEGDLYREILEKNRGETGRKRCARILVAVMAIDQTKSSQDVRDFVKHYGYVNRMAMYGAFIWFGTFFTILAVAYGLRAK